MRSRIFLCALIASFTGFLFGFDGVVISGVNLPLKKLWQTSDWFHGMFIISVSLWGMVVGSLIGGYPTEKFGRKTTLILVGLLFIIAALGTALALSPATFSAFRFIGGVAAGVGSIAAPTYIAEISSAENRGRFGMLFQLNIVLGILVAFLSNYLLIGVGDHNDWRLMLGVMAIPSFVYTALLFTVYESPRWLIQRNRSRSKALDILNQIASKDEVERLTKSLPPEVNKAEVSFLSLFSRKYRRVLLLSFLMAFFNQFSGISFILFYAPEILEKAGLATAESLMGSVALGVVNLFATLIGMYLIDRLGRKLLMYIGSVGYIVSLSMLAYSFYQNLPATFALIFMLLFIIAHAIGQGAVIWVFIAEIFPNAVRSFGQSWGSGLLNGFAAVVTLFGAALIGMFPPWLIFLGFACLMVIQLLFTRFMMPETRSVSLEELEMKLVS